MMSHHTYNTEAIVLGSGPVGEADKLVWLLTRELGLLVARARSAREEKSRMRYALQDFSLSIVSLVRGKTGWRLTGAVLEKSLYAQLENSGTLQAAAKIFDLLKRFIPREEKNEVLFEIVRDGLEDLDEILLVAQILRELGYLQGETRVEDRTHNELLADINEAIIHADL